ncbi:hypothetical protein JCM25156A_29630 [Komagataeibacter kakiaceti JCM 25156]
MPEPHGGNPFPMVTRRKTPSQRELDAKVRLHQPHQARAPGYGIGIEENMGRIVKKSLGEENRDFIAIENGQDRITESTYHSILHFKAVIS